MRLFGRTREARPEVASAAGERLLAWARTGDGGTLAGTRDALHLPGGRRVPWEQVETADWDEESATLHVVEVGTVDGTGAEHRVVVPDPTVMLELVRERVTATVVMQRHVAVRGRRGVFVIARRAPSGDRAVTWAFRHDAGVDPADPDVRRAADEALASARAELGLG